ncbi:phosphoenolpyruvate carboxykinase (ATP), partial [Candidatus Sumerlaeota bacterium]|nr:phosphoenolpyruvate carboxykinase (ATP) [Candidatus Sumerlaeota bacterium]
YRLMIGDQLSEEGVLIFGLSGTGKTTITVCDHDLVSPEGVEILQDDIVLLRRDTSALGTERNFYPKTDSLTDQPELLKAATSEGAILENVFVTRQGEIDFDNQSISTNGRAIAPRHLLPNTSLRIDLHHTDVVFFNTRRYNLPPVGRLISPEQSAAFLMLGESAITSAEDPQRVGESKRVPCFDPFIVDNPHINGNRFYEILKEHPNIKCYLLNTGKVGGVEKGIKITPDVTLNIVEAIMRNTITWIYDPIIGYELPVEIPNVNIKRYDPYKLYGTIEFENIIKRLTEERIEYLEQFPGLDPKIIKAIKEPAK